MSMVEPKNFIFSTGTKECGPVEMAFADGVQIIPAWLVAHLGGTEAVTSEASQAAALTMTSVEFNQRFQAKVASTTLHNIGKQLINQHMKNLIQAERRLPWEER